MNLKDKINQPFAFCARRMTKISESPAIWQSAAECKTCARAQGAPTLPNHAWMMPPMIKASQTCPKHIPIEGATK